MTRKILAIQSDTHGGCSIGLMNPETTLVHYAPDGSERPWSPRPTASQEYLWGKFISAIAEITKLAGDDEIILFDIGDSTHGNKFMQELVSTRLDDQIIIAERNLAPWLKLKNLKKIRLVAGTGAHVYGEGSAPRMIAALVGALNPHLDVRAVEHGIADVNGIAVDYAHHGPGVGIRHWLRGNVARFYLRDLIQQAIMSGERVPDLVLRGHFHAPVYEYLEENGHPCRLMVMPSMCMLGEHGRQATKSTPKVTNGLAAVEIVDGKIVEIHRFYETISISTREVL